MSGKASKTLIGVFVLGALGLAIIAIAIIGSGRLFSTPVRFVMFFESSLKGLSPGSPVTFQGVPIGRVADIQLDGDMQSMEFKIPVYVDMDTKEQDDDNFFLKSMYHDPNVLNQLLERGLRARLNTQSLLTGQLLIELDFFETQRRQRRRARVAERYDGYLVIPTIPSQLDTVWQRLAELPIDEIADNLLTISEQISELLKVPGLKEMPEQVNVTLADAQLTMAGLRATMETYNQVGTAMGKLATSLDSRTPESLKKLGDTLDSYNKLAKRLTKSLNGLDSVVGPNTVMIVELNKALKDISDAARAVRSLASMLEREPESLLRGKGDAK